MVFDVYIEAYFCRMADMIPDKPVFGHLVDPGKTLPETL
jgi:hypothetical protein